MADGSLRIICGPTAAGKSSIALDLAERHGADILSADSRQIYRRFDIGTAKPTPAERGRVQHFGVDIIDPTERYSAARWARDADEWISECDAAGRVPLVVGGTGFYIRALVEPLADSPVFDTAQRLTIGSELDQLSTEDLRRWCVLLDPARADLGRTQLLRAIETALLSGKRLSEFHAAAPRLQPRRARFLVVDRGPELQHAIARRIDAMFASGWVEEVRELAEDVPSSAPAWMASGYAAVRALARGEIDFDAAREKILIETRQYAKRQRTWFRHQIGGTTVTHVDASSPEAPRIIEEWWTRGT
ncbi:MAG TPA: tRNA (adenosine(37)-N6)-dimethylallyltransferase MiaA [Gemmatimonadaceae bacterium]|nr:tRNA (adenosine(37)-N6)-dimethylallyltransferase MiaA [Gemmatimonadaceae bacterium]